MAQKNKVTIPSKNSPKRKVDFLEWMFDKSRDAILKQLKQNDIDLEDKGAVAIFMLKEITKML